MPIIIPFIKKKCYPFIKNSLYFFPILMEISSCKVILPYTKMWRSITNLVHTWKLYWLDRTMKLMKKMNIFSTLNEWILGQTGYTLHLIFTERKYLVYIQKLFVHGENGSLEKTFYKPIFYQISLLQNNHTIFILNITHPFSVQWLPFKLIALIALSTHFFFIF